MRLPKQFVTGVCLTACLAYLSPVPAAAAVPVECDYGQKIGNKAQRVFINMLIGFLEVPRSMINTTNQSNVFFGLTGGLLEGVINTTGRLAVGVFDLLTLPIPTKPVVYPLYVIDDFRQDTTYGNLLEFDFCPTPDVVAAPAPVAAPQPPVVAPRQALEPKQPILPGTPRQTTEKIDTLFKERMMK